MPEKTLVESTAWQATNMPTGVTIDSATGAIAGTPANGTADSNSGSTTYTPTVTVTTPYGVSSKNITIIVRKTYEIRSSDGRTSLARLRNLSDLQSQIRDETIIDRYGLGAQLVLTVSDFYGGNQGQNYECPMVFCTFREWEKENGTKFKGLGLQSLYGFPNGQFDAPEPNNPDTNRKNYGNNRWMYSAIRQYMNSSEANWWQSQHEYDATPQYLNWTANRGLIASFPQSFMDMVQPVKVVTRTHSVDGSVDDVTYDKFFLLSLSELGIHDSTSTDALNDETEGIYWDYQKQLSGSSAYRDKSQVYGATNSINYLRKYSITSTGSRVSSWTRSVHLAYSHYVWCVGSGGNLYYANASDAYSLSPACVLSGM